MASCQSATLLFALLLVLFCLVQAEAVGSVHVGELFVVASWNESRGQGRSDQVSEAATRLILLEHNLGCLLEELRISLRILI